MGIQLAALLDLFEAACTAADELAEIGDARARSTDSRGLKAFAGSAPITRASGKTIVLCCWAVTAAVLISIAGVRRA